MIDGVRKEGRKNSTHCVVDGHLSSQEFGEGATISKKTKVEWPLRGDPGLFCSFCRAMFICVTNDGRKSNGSIQNRFLTCPRDEFFFKFFRLTGNDDHIVCVGVCEHHTHPHAHKQAHFNTSAHVIFSRVAQDTPKRGVEAFEPFIQHFIFTSQRKHSSSLHSFHLHSSPTFHSTIIKSSVDFIFTCRLHLRSSIESVFRSFATNDLRTTPW